MPLSVVVTIPHGEHSIQIEELLPTIYKHHNVSAMRVENAGRDVGPFLKAIEAFEEANSYIPFRENYNNMGVARALMALELKDPDYAEKEFPERFLYPLEIDNQSRLMKELVRGTDYDKEEQIELFLKNAKINFEEAIRLDPGYTKSYINLACVFDLLGNNEGAIGKINELPSEMRKTREALRIRAIANFHMNRLQEAEEIWNQLGIK